jgi:hypothetical protein
MRKQNSTASKTAKAKTSKSKKPMGRLSTQPLPTLEELEKALKAMKPSPTDVEKMQALKAPEEIDKNPPIILSNRWYEFSVFIREFCISKGTGNSWIDKEWLAYSGIGKFRFINTADIEDMMLYFRHPAKRD